MKTCIVYGKLTFLTVNLVIRLGKHFECIHILVPASNDSPDLVNLNKLGDGIHVHNLKFESVEVVSEAILQEIGGIDLLLSLHHVGDPGKLGYQSIDTQWQLGFMNISRLMHIFIPYFRRQQHGILLNVDAMEGWLDEYGYSAFTASHNALAGLTRVASIELAHHGVNVAMMERGYVGGTPSITGLDTIRDRPDDPKAIVQKIIQVILKGVDHRHYYLHSSLVKHKAWKKCISE